jgi:hypothetical protein
MRVGEKVTGEKKPVNNENRSARKIYRKVECVKKTVVTVHRGFAPPFPGTFEPLQRLVLV